MSEAIDHHLCPLNSLIWYFFRHFLVWEYGSQLNNRHLTIRKYNTMFIVFDRTC